jgi:hypothetical protein
MGGVKDACELVEALCCDLLRKLGRCGRASRPRSKRAKTVKAAGIIRPLSIAEVREASCNGVRNQRNPSGTGQVRAYFYDNGLPAGPIQTRLSAHWSRHRRKHFCFTSRAVILLNYACPPFFRRGRERLQWGPSIVRLKRC